MDLWARTFDAITDIVTIQDKDLTIIRANKAAYEFFQASGGSLSGRHCYEVFTGNSEPCARCPLVLTLGNGGDHEALISHENLNKVFRVNSSIIPAGEDQEECLIHIARDVTREIESTRIVQESRAIFLELLDNSGHIVVFKDPKLRYVMINRAYTALTGHSLADVVGKTDLEVFADLAMPEHIERYMVHDRQALSLPPGQSLTAEEQALGPDGSIRTFLTKKFPVYTEDGQLTGAGTITSEITKLKQGEKERETLQAQLIQAQKMESVGRLAGGVAHDFNNMLAVILGYTELALDQAGAGHPLNASLLEIEKAATHSAELTRQLLAFARKQTIAPKVLDLNRTVAGMLKMLRRLIGEDIVLVCLPGKNLRPVKVDPSQIDQILANLCVNARDAITGSGRITIETGTAVLDESFFAGQPGLVPGEFVLLAVSDNGHGMDSGLLDKVFEPYFTTKEMGKGTGLGLSTVYGIVKQNNGLIQVESELNEGTTIRIYLPPYAGAVEPHSKKGRGEPVSPGRETILLVEDEPGVLKITSTMLKLLGYKVLPAGRPSEALRLAGESGAPIDLLMTDVVMPEMNGQELKRVVEKSHPQIKCLLMSGYADGSLNRGGAIREGTYFIEKPFSKKELADRVRMVLRS